MSKAKTKKEKLITGKTEKVETVMEKKKIRKSGKDKILDVFQKYFFKNSVCLLNEKVYNRQMKKISACLDILFQAKEEAKEQAKNSGALAILKQQIQSMTLAEKKMLSKAVRLSIKEAKEQA